MLIPSFSHKIKKFSPAGYKSVCRIFSSVVLSLQLRLRIDCAQTLTIEWVKVLANSLRTDLETLIFLIGSQPLRKDSTISKKKGNGKREKGKSLSLNGIENCCREQICHHVFVSPLNNLFIVLHVMSFASFSCSIAVFSYFFLVLLFCFWHLVCFEKFFLDLVIARGQTPPDVAENCERRI